MAIKEDTLTILRKIKQALVECNNRDIPSVLWLDINTPLLEYIDDSIAAHEAPPVRIIKTLYTQAFDKDGTLVLQSIRSSSEPQRDHELMSGFLELEQAFRLRNVEIVGHKLGALWVTSNPPTLTRDTLKVDAWTYLKAAINVAEAKGQVIGVKLKPIPGQHRMGGYYMVPEVRDGYAESQRKMNAPARVVRASNYDYEMFTESYASDEMTHYGATLLAEKMNDDPKRPHDIYFKVVPRNYTLHAFQP